MRKLLFAVIIAVFTMTSMNAQTFGAKAGLNIANIVGDNIDDGASKIGFAIGAVAEFEISDVFSFQPELVYSSQGNQNDEDSDFKLKMNYLNLPLMAKYYVAENLSIQAGPQIGFLLSAEVTDGDNDTDVKDSLKGIDFGLGLGLGYKMDSGLFFDARYNFGLSDINDFDTDDKNQNSVINFSVGYFFN